MACQSRRHLYTHRARPASSRSIYNCVAALFVRFGFMQDAQTSVQYILRIDSAPWKLHLQLFGPTDCVPKMRVATRGTGPSMSTRLGWEHERTYLKPVSCTAQDLRMETDSSGKCCEESILAMSQVTYTKSHA